MLYSEFAEVYEKLAKTGGKLEKAAILAEFLKHLHKSGKSEWVYLLNGRVFPDYDSREFGISTQLVLKAIEHSYGIKNEEVVKRFNKTGDLGGMAEEFALHKKQGTLTLGKLETGKVFDNLKKLASIEGKGAVEQKIGLIAELLAHASSREAKYIIRTLLGDLKVGVAEGILRDAIAEAFFKGEKEMADAVEDAYNISNDWARVLDAAAKGRKEFEKIGISPGKPIKVMLAVVAKDIKEAFEICGKPAAIEQKYDGFRMVISCERGQIKLFTRRLEDVTKQFPDVVAEARKNVKAESYILDSEVVGYDKKTGKYTPFQAISQRIRRKYDIEKLTRDLPVEVNVFDVLYLNGKSAMDLPFNERRKIIERVVKTEKFKIRTAVQIVTSSEEEAMKFYHEALKIGEEGIMIKKIDAPYKSGRRVGYMAKMKPSMKDLDLAIVGAEYGTGKRGGWLTSYIVACRGAGGKLLEIGKVSSGLKEKESEGTSYEQMTKMLKPLVISTKGNAVEVKPKIVVSVTYQEIQKSPSYASGYALRFPRISAYRPDRRVDDIDTIKDVEKLAGKK